MNYIRLRKNNLCVENVSTLKLVKKYKTPFYCYSLLQLKNNFYTEKKLIRLIFYYAILHMYMFESALHEFHLQSHL